MQKSQRKVAINTKASGCKENEEFAAYSTHSTETMIILSRSQTLFGNELCGQ
jgi:hypothetical protein